MPLGVIVMRNISEITPEQITQRLNEIYKPISYCREMDYFKLKPINASLNVGSSISWLCIDPEKIPSSFHYGTNGSCLWTMLALILDSYDPCWRTRVNGRYMVYHPKIWTLYQQAAATYFKVTNQTHFETNYPIFMGNFISENHRQILELIYEWHDKTETKKAKKAKSFKQSFIDIFLGRKLK